MPVEISYPERPVNPIEPHQFSLGGTCSRCEPEMEKTPARPRWGLVRTYTARALGGGGLESARHFFNLSRIVFGICYRIAHSERRWKRGDNSRSGFPAQTAFTVQGGGKRRGEGIEQC